MTNTIELLNKKGTIGLYKTKEGWSLYIKGKCVSQNISDRKINDLLNYYRSKNIEFEKFFEKFEGKKTGFVEIIDNEILTAQEFLEDVPLPGMTANDINVKIEAQAFVEAYGKQSKITKFVSYLVEKYGDKLSDKEEVEEMKIVGRQEFETAFENLYNKDPKVKEAKEVFTVTSLEDVEKINGEVAKGKSIFVTKTFENIGKNIFKGLIEEYNRRISNYLASITTPDELIVKELIKINSQSYYEGWTFDELIDILTKANKLSYVECYLDHFENTVRSREDFLTDFSNQQLANEIKIFAEKLKSAKENDGTKIGKIYGNQGLLLSIILCSEYVDDYYKAKEENKIVEGLQEYLKKHTVSKTVRAVTASKIYLEVILNNKLLNSRISKEFKKAFEESNPVSDYLDGKKGLVINYTNFVEYHSFKFE